MMAAGHDGETTQLTHFQPPAPLSTGAAAAAVNLFLRTQLGKGALARRAHPARSTQPTARVGV